MTTINRFTIYSIFLLAALGWISSSALASPRVVVLGFDGVDPALTTKMMDAGALPNLDALRKKGTFRPLQTTEPPLSPVAWASFATCKEPSLHGIFDYIGRVPSQYMAIAEIGHLEFPRFGSDGAVARPARYVGLRNGESFWVAADRQGKKCKILRVPFAYPTDTLTNGIMLGGEGVPDIRGSQTTSFWMSDSFTPEQAAETGSGGIRVALNFKDDVASFELSTYRDPQSGPMKFVSVPARMKVNRTDHTAVLELPSGNVEVRQGQWSNWVEWSFQVTPKYTLHAISNVFLIEAGAQVRVYMSCLHIDPRTPMVSISTPENYSADLATRYGLYKTVGWMHDTNAVRKNALPDEEFLNESRRTMEWEQQFTMDELDRKDFDVLVSCTTETDRVSHLFWRFRDAKHPLYTKEGAGKYGNVVEDFYTYMDVFVGKALERLQPDDLLMVVSDHGFHSFRVGFSIPTWLVRNGYLSVVGQKDAATATKEGADFLSGFDWPKTKAYSIGMGGIYLNLKGREAQGTVSPEEAPQLIEEIKQKLLQLTYEPTGEKVILEVYARKSFQSTTFDRAPDLQIAYAEGFQTSKEGAKANVTKEVFLPNTDKWSGEHAASLAAETPGVIFSNQVLAESAVPSILDIGTTVLAYLKVLIPADFQGHSLLASH